MATQLEKLMFSIDLMDRVSGPAGKIKKTLSGVASMAQESFGKITAGFAGVAASGYAIKGLAGPAQEFNMAIGSVRSLDVAQKSLDILSNKAIEFSIKYGESSKDFVTSSYDIQSAIAGLAGGDLASITYTSNVLAKATKADALTITNYMGTMYKVFESSAIKMGRVKWADQLAGQTATAVKLYKTTGNKMAAAYEALGLTGTKAGVSMAEQFAVLGNLQGVMEGGVSGTSYIAFINNVGKAQEKLGLKFTDSTGKMLPMPAILEKIQSKFGNLEKVESSDALKAAFGSEEAVKLIKALVDNHAVIANDIKTFNNVKGLDTTAKMAEPFIDSFQRLTQGIQAVRIGLGQALLPVLLPAVESMAKGAGAIYNWTQEFPKLSKWIGIGIVGVTGITGAVAGFAVMGGIASMVTGFYTQKTKTASFWTKIFSKESIIAKWAMAGWNIAMKAASVGMTVLKGALLATRTGFLWLNAAMYANPIGFVIAGVVALTAGVAAVIYYWDDLKSSFKDIGWVQAIMGYVEKVAGGFQTFGQWMWDFGAKILKVGAMIFLFSNPIGWIITLIGTVIHNWDALKASFFDTAWGQAIMGCVDNIVGKFQAFDAWLSGITTSWSQAIVGWGEAIKGGFQTFGKWIWDFGAKILKVGTMIFLFSSPIGWMITLIRTVIHNWDALKASFFDTSWGQAIMGYVGKIAGGFQTFGQWIWDFGAKILKVGTMIFLFSSPIGWMITLIKTVISHWDEFKASFLDSSWGQAIMGWIDKITGGFKKMTGTFDWVKDKMSWIPGMGDDPGENIPKTSPSLEAPRQSAILPGGASKSIANAVTNNSQSSSNTVQIGQVVSSRPINSQEVGNMLWMGV